MRRFILTLVLSFITVVSFAQNTAWFQAKSFASKPAYSSTWSDWEPSTVKIKFDFTNQTITIYSPVTQYYQVVQQLPSPYDPSGVQEKYQVIAPNGYYYIVRLRIENNGNSQIYVDANDGSIVYNVVRL